MTFSEYAEYVFKIMKREGLKRKTMHTYRTFILPILNEHIGDMKLCDITARHLNTMYSILLSPGVRKKPGSAAAKINLRALLSEKGYSMAGAARKAGISIATVTAACKGENIREAKARALADAIEEPCEKLFEIKTDESSYSDKTVKEIHNLASRILNQAYKEELISRNPTARASPPKISKTPKKCYSPEFVNEILDALEHESIKWRTIITMTYVTGMRRGEVAGLRWKVIDFKEKALYTVNNLQYLPDIGLYEDTAQEQEEPAPYPAG